MPLFAFTADSDLNPFVYLNLYSMFIHFFLQVITLIKAWQSIKHIKYSYNIVKEVVLTLVIWIVATGLYHHYMVFDYEYKSHCHIDESIWTNGIFMLILRNWLLLANIVYTCFVEPQTDKLSSYSVDELSRECLFKVESALATEHTLLKFIEYLAKEGCFVSINQINAYALIKDFEEFACPDADHSNEELRSHAKDIWCKLQISEKEPNPDYVIPHDIKSSIEQKIESADEMLDRHLFDQLYGIIINSLQRSYVDFRDSTEFKTLSADLDRKSLISHKLRKFSLV